MRITQPLPFVPIPPVKERYVVRRYNKPSMKELKFVEGKRQGMTDAKAAEFAGYAKSVQDNAWFLKRQKNIHKMLTLDLYKASKDDLIKIIRGQ